MLRKCLLSLAATAALVLAVVSTAAANPPIIVHVPDVTGTATITDLCASPITLTFTLTNQTVTFFTDQNGNSTETHDRFFEQDTFVGPTGSTLVGDTYAAEVRVLFDSNLNVTHIYGDGPLEKVRLPDGSLFVSAGRVDFLARGAAFVFTPDTGHSGNVAGFCAALGA